MSFQRIKERAQTEWSEFAGAGRRRVLIGAATCGRAAGALEVMEEFRHQLEEHSLTGEIEIKEIGCNGLCYAEPLVEITSANGERVLYHSVKPKMVAKLVESHLRDGEPVRRRALAVMEGDTLPGVPRFKELPMIAGQVRVVMRNCGVIDPTDINHYIARGGYSGLSRALEMDPEQVIDEIKSSGLRGRGGAGFPTGRKWAFARQSPGDQKYVICNADEGDPGAFMDRSVLEGDPHAVLEGLMISGYAIGAQTGYVYIRAEYPLANERLSIALAQMKEHGLLGSNILGRGFDFEILIKKGAGAFVCGEETALIASIEGKRGMPRSRPPFPAVSGLFGKPTNINNVETLASVSAIMEKGADWFSQYGTENSPGTKTFALAGKIERTGLIEVPMGIPLRAIIEDIGGGVGEGKTFKAVQTGGPSGGCMPASLLDTPVDYEHLAEAGSIMGSGGMVVMDEESCMVDVSRYFLSFTENESCGKCTPCRMGTQHLLNILTDICEGRGRLDDIERLRKISKAVADGSLCGLGHTAPNPVLTTIEYFESEYLAHIKDHACPAGVCRNLTEFTILADTCTGCTACGLACPVDAISGTKKEPHVIDQTICIHCGACRTACKFGSVLVGPRPREGQLVGG
ncbi:MAG: NADH-quinone oxidoreductase subunit NuoF [Phycisphaerales bacterium]|nr:MAG: NADH-quinone oxidoreductase subunit NuoF [Phycisphaerales bacterium]